MENILILHGWGIGSKTWDRVKEILEKQGYEVFAPDLPGFGGSPAPERPWSVDDYAEWAITYCRKNNLSRFVLVGHSFGGGISVKLAGQFPNMIKALVLVAAKLRRQKTIRYYAGMILAGAGNLVFYMPLFSFLRPLAQKILYKLLGTSDYYRLELNKAYIMKETFKKVVEEDLTGFLSQIKIPTLIIWGGNDSITPVKDAYLINKQIRGSELEIIENGRHALNLETPEILAEKIIKFIND